MDSVDLSCAIRACMEKGDLTVYAGFDFSVKRPYHGMHMVHTMDRFGAQSAMVGAPAGGPPAFLGSLGMATERSSGTCICLKMGVPRGGTPFRIPTSPVHVAR